MHCCQICKNSTFNTVFSVEEMMFGLAESFEYFQCSACHCLQIAATPENLSRYYGSDYYSFGAPIERTWLTSLLYRERDGYAFTGRGLIGRVLYSFFPRIDYQFLSRLKLSKSDRILDVGCGAGALLLALRRVGFENLSGVDPFIKSDIYYPNGVTVRKTVLSEFSEPQDVVMFNHSLEHMPDQVAALKSAARLVTADGVVVVRVPTVSSFAWEHYGTDWVQLDAPRHLFLHSRESMRIAAEQAGLEVFDHVYDSESFQFWGSEQCKKGIPLFDNQSYAKNPSTSLFSKSEIDDFKDRAVELNRSELGDQVAFFLRRKAA